MDRDEIYEELGEIFEDIFDSEVELDDDTTADDVPGWDSLKHITLISAIEDEFGIKFDMKDVRSLRNVGDMVDLIEELTAQ